MIDEIERSERLMLVIPELLTFLAAAETDRVHFELRDENTQAIGVDPERNTYCLGPKLDFNPRPERFKDNMSADLLLSRFYREPFVVPEDV